AGLHQLDGAAVVTGEADPREYLIRRFARERPADEEFRHEAPGGRGARPEREGFAGKLLGELGGRLEAGLRVGDEQAPEVHVLGALRDRLRSGSAPARLDAGE